MTAAPQAAPRPWDAPIIEALPFAAILTDADGTITEWNRNAELLYGWTADEVIGKSVMEVTVPELSQGQASAVFAALQAGESWSGYFPVHRKGGAVFLCHLQDLPILDADGNVTAILGLSSLATDQLIFKDTIEIAMRAGRLGVWEWDTTTNRVSWSESLEAVFGIEPGSFSGTYEEFASRLHPDDRDRAAALISEAMRGGTSLQFEHRIVLPDGTVRWMEARGEPVLDPLTETFTGMRGVGVDVTGRKHAEQRAEMRQRQQAAIADFGREALIGGDVALLMEHAVAMIADILDVPIVRVVEAHDDHSALVVRAGVGWQPGVVGSTSVDDGLEHLRYALRINQPFVIDDIRTETRFAPPQVLLDHGVVSGISALIRGRRRPWGVLGAHTVEYRHFEDDDVYFMRSVANLLGLAIEARDALQIREDFVSLVSHELRNPLTTIYGFASLAQRRARERVEGGDADLEMIVRESRKMITTLQSLVDLARLDSDQLAVELDEIDLVAVVAAEVRALRVRNPEVTVHEQYEAPAIHVRSDGARIGQIVTNLLDNAVKYGAVEGTLAVEVHLGDGVAMVSVRDNGPGIGPEDLTRIFERFYRSSDAAASQTSGSGLGLYISQQVAKRLGARITCNSQVGEGAEFVVTIPTERDPSAS